MTDPRQSDEGNREEQSRERQDEHESREPIDQELLESILNQTLAAEPDSNLYRLIVRFAERNSDRKITQPEVAEALVEEILQHRFNQTSMPTGCSEWIADSLLNDPDARDRLKKLWANAVGQANAN